MTNSEYQELITISPDEAKEIARLFLKDAIHFKNNTWSNDTRIVNVVPLYSNSDTNEITAYSIELSQGYIIVSAYADTPSLIPEWSDKASPLYSKFKIKSNERILYLGNYDYYLDSGNNNVESLNGNFFNKQALTNAYKTYMKVADGWYTSPRYIDLATCLGDSYISIKFN